MGASLGSAVSSSCGAGALSLGQLSLLVLSALKVDLTSDFSGAVVRYGLAASVGEVIASLSMDEIRQLSQLFCGNGSLFVLANAQDPSYWTALKTGLAQAC